MMSLGLVQQQRKGYLEFQGCDSIIQLATAVWSTQPLHKEQLDADLHTYLLGVEHRPVQRRC